ncbi:MAG: hypothetical protein J5I94_14310 [Phaeodactylibacter sp.]|nr:hypothetical protein [Phaeodactylibacter sp.]
MLKETHDGRVDAVEGGKFFDPVFQGDVFGAGQAQFQVGRRTADVVRLPSIAFGLILLYC